MHCLIFIQLIISSFPCISLFLNGINLGFRFFFPFRVVFLPYPCSCSFISLGTPPFHPFWSKKIRILPGSECGGPVVRYRDRLLSLSFKWEKHEILLLFPTVIVFLDFPAEIMLFFTCPFFKNETSILLIQKCIRLFTS